MFRLMRMGAIIGGVWIVVAAVCPTLGLEFSAWGTLAGCTIGAAVGECLL